MTKLITPKIGEKIYLKGKYSLTYGEYIFVGETSRSWLLTTDQWVADRYWEKSDDRWYLKSLIKRAKSELKSGEWSLGSREDVILASWTARHKSDISRKVGLVTDPTILLEIAKLVGHPLPENENTEAL